MSEHLVLIDGYNVIRRSPQLARSEKVSLQHGRDALITLLACRYGGRSGTILVVFDGAERTETRTVQLGISILFSAQGCTADSCIVRLACEARERGQRVTVATDDAEIRAILGGVAPSTQIQPTAQLNQDLYAADRVRTKQYRHRTAIKQILADQDDRLDHPRLKRGNPRRAPHR